MLQRVAHPSLFAVQGPVRVTSVQGDVISASFVHACVASGLPAIADFNGPERTGAGFYQFMIRDVSPIKKERNKNIDR